MPTLLYNSANCPRAGVLTGRVLIGRRLSSGIDLADPTVARLHAWIDPMSDDANVWMVTDAGSKGGSFVNDQKITNQPLHDGDRIRVGKFTLTYRDTDVLPADVQAIDFSANGHTKMDGILFECTCGAPLWVGKELAGKRGMCRHCRKPVTVPKIELPPAVAPRLKPSSTKRPPKCAVCHSVILEEEEFTQCPDCAMSFHAECWEENLGCSSYGCPKVDSLKPSDEAAEETAAETAPVAEADVNPTPWDLILLAGSAVGLAVGLLTFGAVSAVVAGTSLVFLIKKKQRRPIFLVGAILISIVGIALGLAVSDFWYFEARHIPAAIMKRLVAQS